MRVGRERPPGLIYLNVPAHKVFHSIEKADHGEHLEGNYDRKWSLACAAASASLTVTRGCRP